MNTSTEHLTSFGDIIIIIIPFAGDLNAVSPSQKSINGRLYQYWYSHTFHLFDILELFFALEFSPMSTFHSAWHESLAQAAVLSNVFQTCRFSPFSSGEKRFLPNILETAFNYGAMEPSHISRY